jgi:hypothetical protein
MLAFMTFDPGLFGFGPCFGDGLKGRSQRALHPRGSQHAPLALLTKDLALKPGQLAA